MLNFREELEKVKQRKPEEFYVKEAEKVLKEVLERLKNLEYDRFKNITVLHFSNKDEGIKVSFNNSELLYICTDYDLYKNDVFKAIIKIVKNTCPETSVFNSNLFEVKI